MRKNIITICGGGSLGHTVATVIGHQPDAEVRVLTRRPSLWDQDMNIIYRNSSILSGQISMISDDPAIVIPGASMVLLTVPAFAYSDVLDKVMPHLDKKSMVGAIPGTGGFEWASTDLIRKGHTVFGMQRSPYNCRIKQYGKSVDVLGVRGQSYVASRPSSAAPSIAKKLARLLQLPVEPLPNYLNVTLTPSNAFLHTSRLFSMWKGWDGKSREERKTLFYESWDDYASELFLKSDQELQHICRTIPIDLSGIVPIKKHYQANTPAELTRVIRNIDSLKGIAAPQKKTSLGWIPDMEHRFFTEDIAVNLHCIKYLATIAKVKTPTIDLIVKWGNSLLPHDNKQQSLSRVGIATVQDLVRFYNQ